MSDASTGEILWQDNDWSDLLTERDSEQPQSQPDGIAHTPSTQLHDLQ